MVLFIDVGIPSIKTFMAFFLANNLYFALIILEFLFKAFVKKILFDFFVKSVVAIWPEYFSNSLNVTSYCEYALLIEGLRNSKSL